MSVWVEGLCALSKLVLRYLILHRSKRKVSLVENDTSSDIKEGSLSRKKDQKRRYKTKQKISCCHQKIANLREGYSRKIVDNPQYKIIVLEDLRIKNMTANPKAKQTETGHCEGARKEGGRSAKRGRKEGGKREKREDGAPKP